MHLEDGQAHYAAVDGFLFLSTSGWTDARYVCLRQALMDAPRPVVIANADLAAPRETGFSPEPGHIGHHLLDDLGGDIRFFGKPFPEVYTMVEASLAGIKRNRIAMVGDTLHTDIVGAAAQGWRTVLATNDGMFAGHDVGEFCQASGVKPDWQVSRI